MLEAIKGLVDNGIINEDTRKSIQEAWDAKLSEAKVEITNELREEYAQKYEHDKATIVEALDTMTKDWLKSEISEFAADKKALAADRVALKKAMRENAKKVNTFILELRAGAPPAAINPQLGAEQARRYAEDLSRLMLRQRAHGNH